MKFTNEDMNLIISGLYSLKYDIEKRILETRKVIQLTGEINKYSRTIEDKYTYKEIQADLEIIKRIDMLLEKIDT